MRTKILTTAIAIIMIGINVEAQVIRKCGTMDNLEMLKQADPTLAERMEAIERFTEKWISGNSNLKAGTIYRIPVVVHVVYNTTSENISDAQIQSQITVLNQDFRRTNADKVNTPSTFSTLAADCEIEFCLASIDPSGNATTGITRTYTSTTSFTQNNNMKYNSTGGKDAWNSSQYLNLWVCDLGSSLLGYAQFPGGPASTDGVVIHYAYFGSGGSAVYPFNKGRTASHEVGHWLNLYHIWGDAACGNDNVNDTPVQYADNAGCPSHPKSNSCGTTAEMFMNYMDYTDDACMNLFSAGQSSRMRALFAAGGARVNLLTSTGCGGTVTPAYCSAKGANTGYEWISNVKLNTINNTSGANGGYADFTAISTGVTKSTAYTITLTPAFSGSTYTEYFGVWIDYNQDKDFVDAGENVYNSAGSTAAVNGTFTISSTALTGTTRMRVIMKDGAITGPCEQYTYGEAEDYSVTITTATTTCGNASGLSASSITSGSVTLNWTAVTGAVSYNVRYKPASSTTWATTASATNSKSISALTASTSYEFQVQTVCSGSSSGYSASATFTTSAATSATSNTLTIGTGTGTTTTAPYGTYYMDERIQMIITNAELVAAGYTSTNNKIRSLAFNTTTASTQTMYGFTIKVSHTSASSFGSGSFLAASSPVTVYSANTAAAANVWKTHTFSTAFTYNGTSNLLVEICWNNSTYTSNTYVKYTATSLYRTLYYRADVASGGVCSNATGTRTYNRPNMRLVFSSSSTAKEGNQEEMFEESSLPPGPQMGENPPTIKLYPNPVISMVNIAYYVNVPDAIVSISIYDMLGQVIASSEKISGEAGDYVYTYNFSDHSNPGALSRGIYFCTVNINGNVMSRNFMLAK